MKAGEPLYVSAGKDRGVVSRFGLERTYIGARRSADDPRRLEFDYEEIVHIPGSETRLYLREYQKALAEGALVERSAEDFEAWNATVEKRAKAEQEKAEAEAKAAKEAAEKEANKLAADKVAKQQLAEKTAAGEGASKAANISLEDSTRTSKPGNLGNRS